MVYELYKLRNIIGVLTDVIFLFWKNLVKFLLEKLLRISSTERGLQQSIHRLLEVSINEFMIFSLRGYYWGIVHILRQILWWPHVLRMNLGIMNKIWLLSIQRNMAYSSPSFILNRSNVWEIKLWGKCLVYFYNFWQFWTGFGLLIKWVNLWLLKFCLFKTKIWMKNLSLNQMLGFLISQITHFKYLYVSGKTTGNVCLTFAILKEEFRWRRTFMESLRGGSLSASIFVVNFPTLWGLCRLMQFCTTSLLIGVMLSRPILILNYQDPGADSELHGSTWLCSSWWIIHPECSEPKRQASAGYNCQRELEALHGQSSLSRWSRDDGYSSSKCRDVVQISPLNVMFNF